MREENQDRRRSVLTAGLVAAFAYLLFLKKRETVPFAGGEGESAYMPLVVTAANATNVPPSILASIVNAESSWRNAPTAYSAGCRVNCIASKNCAIGIAQVLPATANMSAQQLCEPANSLIAGARYLRAMYNKYYTSGTTTERAWYLAAMAYNQGPGNVAGWLSSGQTSPNNKLPNGTRTVSDKGLAYADKVLRGASTYASRGVAGLGSTAQTVSSISRARATSHFTS